MTLTDLLMAASLADSWPQEKFEGHGALGFLILVAAIAIIWGLASGDD